MKKIRVYLDSCILISFFSKSEKEKKNKKVVEAIIEKIGELKAVETCISPWVIAETVNILINNHNMSNKQVWDIESSLINKKRFGKLKIKILNPKNDSQEDYDFEEFFHDIRETNLKYHPGLADAMHIVIMKNNDVAYVLTFNPDDFKKVEGLIVVPLEEFLPAK